MIKKLLFLIVMCLVLGPAARVVADEQVIVGYLLFEYYDDIPGSTIADLYAGAIFPYQPTAVEWRESFEGPTNRAENYGTRAGGYLIPPETGAYTFWVASDDASELWLSSDADYNKSVLIAQVPGWANPRQWDKDPNQQSEPIDLVAGQMYYIEVVHKEGGSGDNMAVAWAGPGIGDSPTVIDGQYLSPYISGPDDPLILQYYKARMPAPGDKGLASSTEPLLTWASIIFAQSYQVYLSTNVDDVTDGTAAADKGRATTNAYQAQNLEMNTTYYWRIDGLAPGNVVYPGRVWSFTVSSKTASQPSPPDGVLFADPNTSLSWTAGMGAIEHHLYLGQNPDDVVAGAAATDRGVLTDTSFVPGTLERGKTYYWRVDESDGTQTSIGVLWSFQVEYDVPIADPSLIGWWKFEEGAQRAIDWSGHGNNGTIHGDPVWAPSEDGMALDFDGQGDYVDTGKTATQLGLAGNAPRTVTAWIFIRSFNGAGIYEMGSHNTAEDFSLTARSGITNRWRMQYWKADVDFDMNSLNRWVHVTHTHDGTESRIYADGQLIVTHPVTLNTTDGKTLKIGAYRSFQFDGIIDDVRLYNRALTAEEIPQVMRGNLLQAWSPSPARYAEVDAEHITELSFNAGDGAVRHDVYFGTSSKAVTEGMADASISPVYQGRIETTQLPIPGQVEMGTTYYWRVDEIDANGLLTKGKIWSFNVTNYLIVDDFESYGAEDTPGVAGERIWYVWNDGYGWTLPEPGNHGNGTCAMVDLATTPVHTGNQALTVSYYNDGVFTNIFGEARTVYRSEITRTFASPQDWTRNGINTLTLWFYGAVTNGVEPLYVTLLDDAGVVVAAANYSDTAALTDASWHEWPIDLTMFTQAGASLSSVKTMVIGVGQSNGTQPGGTGTLCFDDIRLETR
jgi:hypothetical protein